MRPSPHGAHDKLDVHDKNKDLQESRNTTVFWKREKKKTWNKVINYRLEIEKNLFLVTNIEFKKLKNNNNIKTAPEGELDAGDPKRLLWISVHITVKT